MPAFSMGVAAWSEESRSIPFVDGEPASAGARKLPPEVQRRSGSPRRGEFLPLAFAAGRAERSRGLIAAASAVHTEAAIDP